MTEAGVADVLHVERDERYDRMLREEAAFWDRPHLFTLDVEWPVTDAYHNERFSGDAKTGWYETICRYGTFRRGLMLGAGWLRHEERILETNPSLTLTFYDVSGESLARRERELGEKFPGRVMTRQEDLNFVELEEDAYDVIISSGCMHHLLNLEHMAFQINRSLAPGGYFFLHDYVGETRYQFVDAKKRLFAAAFERAQAHHRFLRHWKIVWPKADLSNREDVSPFEGVRSEETLEIFRRYLNEVSVREAGALFGLMMMIPQQVGHPGPLPAGWRGRARRAAARLLGRLDGSGDDARRLLETLGPELIPLDRAVCDSGLFRPWNAFAVYRKREHAAGTAG